jgi:hypothetical protein
MAAEDSQRLAQDFIEAFNEGEWNRYSQLVAPEVVLDERTIEKQTYNAEDLIERLQEVRAAAPGIRINVDSWVAADDGSVVAGEVAWTRDDLEGNEAVSGTIFLSIEEGRVRTIHELHAPLPQRLRCPICMPIPPIRPDEPLSPR